MQLFMIRHGQSLHNAQRIVTGQQDSPLTEVGRHQIKLAGEKLKDKKIGLIVCSPLIRTKETAQILAQEIDYPLNKIAVMPDLKERSVGELEGKSYAQNARMNGNYPETESIKGVEPLEHLHGRVNHALRSILQRSQGKNVLIVAHMNVGRMLWAITKGQPAQSLYDQPRLENGQIYPLIIT